MKHDMSNVVDVLARRARRLAAGRGACIRCGMPERSHVPPDTYEAKLTPGAAVEPGTPGTPGYHAYVPRTHYRHDSQPPACCDAYVNIMPGSPHAAAVIEAERGWFMYGRRPECGRCGHTPDIHMARGGGVCVCGCKVFTVRLVGPGNGGSEADTEPAAAPGGRRMPCMGMMNDGGARTV